LKGIAIFVSNMEKVKIILILSSIIGTLFWFFYYESIFGLQGGGKPPIEDDESILIKRDIIGYPSCPSGWSDGGTGISSYGGAYVYERYCY